MRELKVTITEQENGDVKCVVDSGDHTKATQRESVYTTVLFRCCAAGVPIAAAMCGGQVENAGYGTNMEEAEKSLRQSKLKQNAPNN